MKEFCRINKAGRPSQTRAKSLTTRSAFFKCSEIIILENEGIVVFRQPDIDYRGKPIPTIKVSKNIHIIYFHSEMPPGKYFFEDDGDEDSRTILFDEP